MSRALTDHEHRCLLLADENQDSRAYPLKSGVRDRLLEAGWIQGGGGIYYITDAGRRVVHEQGNSGGRA